MKPLFKFVVFSTVMLASSTVLAANVSMVAKTVDSKDGTRRIYTYNYTCSNSTRGTLTVWAANDNDAQKKAESQARNVCEEL